MHYRLHSAISKLAVLGVHNRSYYYHFIVCFLKGRPAVIVIDLSLCSSKNLCLMRDQRVIRPLYVGSQGVRSLVLPLRHNQPARKGWRALLFMFIDLFSLLLIICQPYTIPVRFIGVSVIQSIKATCSFISSKKL